VLGILGIDSFSLAESLHFTGFAFLFPVAKVRNIFSQENSKFPSYISRRF
jgi:hypothetical protein